jgi:hypothetical protein
MRRLPRRWRGSAALQHSLVRKIEMNAARLIMMDGMTTMPMPVGYMFQLSEIHR